MRTASDMQPWVNNLEGGRQLRATPLGKLLIELISDACGRLSTLFEQSVRLPALDAGIIVLP
jgi:hypothetical protein